MLVLTRHAGEEIVIGNDIRVAVVAIKGNKVRIGITAPSVVDVCRSELLDRDSSPGLSKADSIHSQKNAGVEASENH